MLDWTAAIVAGVGLLLLSGFVLMVSVPLRRFRRAAAAMRADTSRAMLPLRALLKSAVLTSDRDRGRR